MSEEDIKLLVEAYSFIAKIAREGNVQACMWILDHTDPKLIKI